MVQYKYEHDSEFHVSQSAQATVIPPLADVTSRHLAKDHLGVLVRSAKLRRLPASLTPRQLGVRVRLLSSDPASSSEQPTTSVAAKESSLLDLHTVCTQSTVPWGSETETEAEVSAQWDERFVFAVTPPASSSAGDTLELRVELLDWSPRSAAGRVLACGYLPVKPDELRNTPLSVVVPLVGTTSQEGDDAVGDGGSLSLELCEVDSDGAAHGGGGGGGGGGGSGVSAASRLKASQSPTPVALSPVGLCP